MQKPAGNGGQEDIGGAGEDTFVKPGETGAVKRFLSGKAKRASVKPAAEAEGGRTVNPRMAWSDERKAARRASWAAKRAAKAGAKAGTQETILEVKGEPEPEKPAPKPSKEDVEGWAGLLYLGHVIGANLLRIPELQLQQGEAADLSVASMNVMRHYSGVILSEKTQDWIKLAMVAGQIYIPKVAAAKSRKAAAKAANTQPPQGINAAGGIDRPEAPPIVEEPIEPEMEIMQ